MGPWGLDSQVVLSYSTATRQVDNATRQQLHAAAVVEAESLGGSAAGAKRSAHGAVHKAVNEGYIDEVLRQPHLFQVQDRICNL